MKKNLLPVLLLFTASATLAQPQQYITDRVYAPLRSEQGEKGKLLHDGLESGTAVTVLERNEQTGYARVRTADHVEGWLRSQYLSSDASATVQLEQANAQIARLQAEKTQLEEELLAVKQISASQIDTHERNTELVKQNQLLISEKEVLMTDNERLQQRNNQTWFLYGGFLVAISALRCALIPRLGKQRRNDGWA